MIRSTKTWHPGALITSIWASSENSPRCLQDLTSSHRRTSKEVVPRMGRRCQPRKRAEVQVRIFGTDSDSHVFSEKVCTANISRNGATVAGVRPELGLDDIVGLT